jgi:DnaJ-class molecular chaperone
MTRRGSSSAAGCPNCEGEGYTMAVYGQLDTIEECSLCDGTGDRFGRGPTKPIPEARDARAACA